MISYIFSCDKKRCGRIVRGRGARRKDERREKERKKKKRARDGARAGVEEKGAHEMTDSVFGNGFNGGFMPESAGGMENAGQTTGMPQVRTLPLYFHPPSCVSLGERR